MLRELHHFSGGKNVAQEDVWQDNVVRDAGCIVIGRSADARPRRP